MKQYIFIHGAYHDKNGWNKLVEHFNEKVHLIDLPRQEGVDLNKYVEHVIKYINENQLEEVYLIGHSFGGVVATHVAINIPMVIKKIILISGVVLPKSISFIDILPKPVQTKYSELLQKGIKNIPINEEYIKKIFLNDVEDEDIINEYIQTLIEQPIKPYFNKSDVDDFSKITYIRCTKDLAVNDEMFSHMSDCLKEARIINFASGHIPMLVKSKELAEVIKGI